MMNTNWTFDKIIIEKVKQEDQFISQVDSKSRVDNDNAMFSLQV